MVCTAAHASALSVTTAWHELHVNVTLALDERNQRPGRVGL
jgi:hypothetical protein